jgi:predicted nuclease with TOPRIM domain
MENKILETLLEMKNTLIEVKQDLKEIKQKQSEHDRKFNAIAETLERVFTSIEDTNNRLDVLAIDTHKNKAEINKLKKIQ